MRILISGASGFVGQPLSFFLSSQGHTIIPLLRNSEPRSSDAVYWDPEAGKAHKEDFKGFDTVIHLAGEPLTLSRWSAQKKEKILLSRTKSTSFLSHLLSTVDKPPQLFLSASAYGYYGDRGEEALTEESGAGDTFLAKVCSAWEEASLAIADRGVRVVQARFGIVIGPNGGILKKMVPPYKWGFGGKLGSGKQWVSWIALDDLIRGIDHIIHEPSLQGPVNFVSPEPIRQEEFASTLASVLHRPSFLALPSWLLRAILGETADEMILSSTRALPDKLLASKFIFIYSELRSALKKALQTT